MYEEQTLETEETFEISLDDYVEHSAEALESYSVSVEPVDYTPVIYDAVSTLATVILAGALMIVGCLMGFKIWEVPHK